jgi:peptide/nickel transport system permease protein
MTARSTENIFLRVVTSPSGFIAVAYLAVLAVVAVFAQAIAPYGPDEVSGYNFLASPSADHWLGTDAAARDVFSRVVFGTRPTVLLAAFTLTVSFVLGTSSGLVAGYFGGWFDQVSNWAASLSAALPGMVVLLTAAAVLGNSTWIAMFIFGVLLSPLYFRLVYAAARSVRTELFVDAARVAGLGDARIIARHVLSAIRAPIIVQTGLVASIAVGIQAALMFLGLGDGKTITWGMLLQQGFNQMYEQPLIVVWPATLLSLTTLMFVMLSNTLRDELERTSPRNLRVSTVVVSDEQRLADLAAQPSITHGDHTSDGEIILDVQGLAIGYADGHGSIKQVVHEANFRVHRGEAVGLIGESGSGKTQSVFAVLGTLPEGGRVVNGSMMFEGRDLVGLSRKQYKDVRAKVSYVPQEPMTNLDPSFTIGTQMIEPIMAVLGMNKKQAKERAIDLLARVGIPDPVAAMRKFPHEISGGQAQRVLIAGAISCEPDLIIADEPTTALDVTVQAEILDLLRSLQKETNTALLLVTHNFGVVADLCDYVHVMQAGRIVEDGPVRKILREPRHPYTQALLGAVLEGGPARPAYELSGGVR